MDFALTDEQVSIRSAIEEICADLPDDWLKKDRDGSLTGDFYLSMAAAGWLGIAMPAEYGGVGRSRDQRSVLYVGDRRRIGCLLGGRAFNPHECLLSTPGSGSWERRTKGALVAADHSRS
jgi:alkylation response protein AidB-like acyl-CoA dehydrogenase